MKDKSNRMKQESAEGVKPRVKPKYSSLDTVKNVEITSLLNNDTKKMTHTLDQVALSVSHHIK